LRGDNLPIEKRNLAPEDLVLKLNDKANELDISEYEDFIFELCGDRWEFQKEAIRIVIKYYLSKVYTNSKQLLKEVYSHNEAMKEFGDENIFLQNLPFPDKLSCTVDLATGTGKTWVMYGVARILLAEGFVDQVLILCPGRTVKEELLKKFNRFNQNATLTDSLPKRSKIRLPAIKQANETIEKGDICIDNVHKTYDHVSSSISDSLIGKGARTLIINDEAHHILNPKESEDKTSMIEWKSFLIDPRYKFNYILNCTGTPYKGDSYFNDVIYRFSIRNAIKKKFVKDINYLKKDETKDWNQKWKTILTNHEKLKKAYPKAKKHITMVVTNSIRNTDALADEIKTFLSKNTHYPKERIGDMVLPVTSSPNHEHNREILKTVDNERNPVEWIVSVSMLTEGWDVANVFQIVPHDSRAFNSKLLISQVLGRGLRIPPEYIGEQPQVWIYNHAAWSPKIDNLVMEVADISETIRSSVISNSKYNFDLHKMRIEKKISTKKKVEVKTTPKLPENFGFITTKIMKEQTFINVRERRETHITTNIGDQIKKYTIDEATNAIFTNIYLFDRSAGTELTKKVSKDYIRQLLKKELKKIGEDTVSEENLQNAKASFNVLLRQYTGVSRIEDLYGNIEILNTSKAQDSFLSVSSFKRYGGLVTSKNNLKKMKKEDIEVIEKLKKESKGLRQTNLANENYVFAKILDDLDDDGYRSPLDVTLLSHEPERDFVEMLVRNYVKYIDAWFKSKDNGFYSIPYIYRPGTHSLQKEFNPDFFIKKDNRMIVAEIKSEDDSSVKNKDKLEGTKAYFEVLNKKLSGKTVYEFYFLEPSDYTNFFDKVIVNGKQFRGSLHAQLETKTRAELKEGR
jgi:type III restriction enzyme